ncbi:menaquinone-dependent protoporphyrinogen oxidase [Fodinibius roseus]|uniref:Menaquinone-dependent protoporphyrinogen oxidase n=1 Tax=Fodinibius roseus TaxID=1194090 RepID=A0A1M4X6E7_9BACT|nr:menaquinone-dependent protoporphyrinogen IX dehydrogenase [Fodinibius roseus]SHE89070.1 menaquinone-dependent protoporphyrinogen oxidase [Fodinibius roseus]
MKLLIVYGTTEGQTRKICNYLRDKATGDGHQVTIVDATGPDVNPNSFDAAIIGASLHAEKYQNSVEHYVQEHRESLNKMPTGFLSVSLAAVHDDPQSQRELREISNNFLEKSGWSPTIVEQVAGALRYTKYNFFKKFIMRMIAQKSGGSTDTSKDTEYTDWNQVNGFLTNLEKEVAKE